MRNVYLIDQFDVVHNEIYFILNEKKQLSQFQPAGQVLADSDNGAFLYLIDENDAYSYLRFDQSIWPQLVHMILSEQKAFLTVDDGAFELNDFSNELKSLLYNIEGNGNYGETFVKAVEEAFADFFAQN
ncbi:hypothetical protein LZ480_02295 [Solibacillus sp. MA9]|uniref:Uncharacterized protein n=1 Tax=Solibacillus palustris TaxID=2908203 RepID=A0ABS9U8N6_9BACL|nr:hypothetical protein [Solibacillus sp. MA9]MCH7320706.1 hypothetical protein [Solibacillus sp. MA9]